MFCPACGQENLNSMKFCGNCGGNIEGLTGTQSIRSSEASYSMTFGKAVTTCFHKYFAFEGRASRPEYWWFTLFTVIISVVTSLLDGSQTLEQLANLIFLFPSLAVGARRLHDTGRSGWWQLIAITIIGLIPLVIWLASEGSKQENEYGQPA